MLWIATFCYCMHLSRLRYYAWNNMYLYFERSHLRVKLKWCVGFFCPFLALPLSFFPGEEKSPIVGSCIFLLLLHIPGWKVSACFSTGCYFSFYQQRGTLGGNTQLLFIFFPTFTALFTPDIWSTAQLYREGFFIHSSPVASYSGCILF